MLALSGATSSFAEAVGLGSAYVFGMVAPLFAISLLWERVDWRSTRLFRPRSLGLRLGPMERSISATALASAVLLTAMGAAMVVIGLTSNSMPSSRGWPAELSAHLQHYAKVVTDALAFMPGWAAGPVLVAIVALLARRAIRQVTTTDPAHDIDAPGPSQTGAEGESSTPASHPEYV